MMVVFALHLNLHHQLLAVSFEHAMTEPKTQKAGIKCYKARSLIKSARVQWQGTVDRLFFFIVDWHRFKKRWIMGLFEFESE